MNDATERTIERAGSKHKYQWILLFLVFLFSITTCLGLASLPYLEEDPLVNYKDAKTNQMVFDVKLSEEVCAKAKAIYIKKESPNSLVSEFNLGCDKFKVSTIGSAYYLGNFFSVFILAWLTESYGRKTILLVSAFAFSVFAIFCTINLGFWWTMSNLCLVGTFDQIVVSISFVLMFEVLYPTYRTWFGTILNLAFGIGALITILLYQVIQDWRLVFFSSAIATVILSLITYFYAIESPRFFLIKQNFTKFRESIFDLATKNNRLSECSLAASVDAESEVTDTNEDSSLRQTTFSQDLELIQANITANEAPKAEFTELYSSSKYFGYFLVLSYLWCYSIFTYSLLGVNIKNLSGDIYQNGYYMYGIEVWSYILCGILMDSAWFGRKGCYFVFNLVSMTCSIACFWVHPASFAFSMLNIVNRFGANGSITVLYIYSSEIFPTKIRAVGASSVTLLSRLISIIAPFVLEFFTAYIYWILIVINGINLLVASRLEETRNVNLDEDTTKKVVSFKV